MLLILVLLILVTSTITISSSNNKSICISILIIFSLVTCAEKKKQRHPVHLKLLTDTIILLICRKIYLNLNAMKSCFGKKKETPTFSLFLSFVDKQMKKATETEHKIQVLNCMPQCNYICNYITVSEWRSKVKAIILHF